MISYELRLSSLGEKDLYTIDSLERVAECYQKLGEYEIAETKLVEILNLRDFPSTREE